MDHVSPLRHGDLEEDVEMCEAIQIMLKKKGCGSI